MELFGALVYNHRAYLCLGEGFSIVITQCPERGKEITTKQGNVFIVEMYLSGNRSSTRGY